MRNTQEDKRKRLNVQIKHSMEQHRAEVQAMLKDAGYYEMDPVQQAFFNAQVMHSLRGLHGV